MKKLIRQRGNTMDKLASSDDPTFVRRSASIDRLCDEFEAAWRRGDHPCIDQILASADRPIRKDLCIALIRVELELLGKSGEAPSERDYRQRFPEYVAEFNQVFPGGTNRSSIETQGWGSSEAVFAKDVEQPGLVIRCPHCRNPIELTELDPKQQLTCPSCGSNFNLIDGQSTSTFTEPAARRIGQFELVEQLGSGAFGSVWKARDTDLDRVVAIKIPRKDQLDADEIEQFFREARAAAQLRHPNIVSVHEVGRDGSTVYIVSDLIRGVTLTDWLTGQRPTAREAATICAQVATALQHAHDRGVIHRDLKPANVMVDGDDQPHIMDFGLAKREAGEITMTVEGRILGTPAYMSPEQARGDAHTVDRRADVYSLGVILFQLLTGELPFRGTPRMLLHQVLNDEPRAPRTLNDRIPHDLETICLKAMAKEPVRRYESAQALADDLNHWLKGEPILARPVGRLERAWRWAKRNPRVAVLSGSVLALLITVAVGATVAAIQISAARGLAQQKAVDERKARLAAEQSRTEAVAQKRRAEQGFREARETVDQFFTTISENDLLDAAGMQPLRERLLHDAVEHYQHFAGQVSDPNVQAELAKSLIRFGDLLQKRGSATDALRCYEQAANVLEPLVATHPQAIDYQRNLAINFHNRAILERSAGRTAEAEAHYNQAIEIQSRLAQADPAELAYQQELAASYGGLANLQRDAGRDAESEINYRQAIDRTETLIVAQPAELDYQSRLAHLSTHLARLLGRQQRDAEAEFTYQKAISLGRKLVAIKPESLAFRHNLATAYHNLALLYSSRDRGPESEANYQQAIELEEQLAGENPTVLQYQADLAASYTGLAGLDRIGGQVANAVAHYQQAFEIDQRLVTAAPTARAHQLAFSRDGYNLATVRIAQGEYEQALAPLQQSVTVIDKLVTDSPSDEEVVGQAARSHAALARVWVFHQRGDNVTALQSAERALALIPDDYSTTTAHGAMLYRLGRYADARTSLDRARSQIETTLSDRLHVGSMAGAEFYRPVVELLMAMVDQQQGDGESAKRRLKQADTWLAEQQDATAETARFAGEGIDRTALAAEAATLVGATATTPASEQ